MSFCVSLTKARKALYYKGFCDFNALWIDLSAVTIGIKFVQLFCAFYRRIFRRCGQKMNFDLTRRHFIHNSKICTKHVNSPIIYHYKLSRTRTAGGFFQEDFWIVTCRFWNYKIKREKALYFFRQAHYFFRQIVYNRHGYRSLTLMR